MNASVQPDENAQAVILCVDDEPNILSSLQRLLRRENYKVLTAPSAAEGLILLEQHPVDLVMSDMRMPEMDGSQFLQQVRQRWPETVRILLTGYADVQSTMAAINQGEIFRYIAKPWDDNDVLLLVKHALERKLLQQDKQRLEALTQEQNEALKTLNASLEVKVQERTRALQEALHEVEKSNGELRKNFLTSVAIFSNLMELRAGNIGGHSRRVADFARKLANQMSLPADEVQNIVLAGLLHDIGKIGLPDTLLIKSLPSLTPDELAELRRHPQIAQTALTPLPQLKSAASLIRSHHERFDGHGYPDHLSGFAIPLGARILTLANDYDALQNGGMLSAPLTPAKAYEFIVEARGKRYDPSVVDAFKELIGSPDSQEEVAVKMHSADIKPGMILAKGLFTSDGLLLLFKDCVMDEKLIEQMIKYEQSEKKPLTFWIKSK
ncbi:MAG: HD domain-containing phosphohydrolase [Gallionellaceae bacterium]|jgi:response regulator RpfG family c-di-GMP phosphodiesterase